MTLDKMVELYNNMTSKKLDSLSAIWLICKFKLGKIIDNKWVVDDERLNWLINKELSSTMYLCSKIKEKDKRNIAIRKTLQLKLLDYVDVSILLQLNYYKTRKFIEENNIKKYVLEEDSKYDKCYISLIDIWEYLKVKE